MDRKIKNAIQIVSKEQTKKIIYEMKKIMCLLNKNIGSTRIGFFTKIPHKNEYIKLLITNNPKKY